MYKVIHFFTDLQDNSHPYNVGETFPREGVSVTEERLEELSGKHNLQGKPLIQLVDDFSKYMNAPEETVANEKGIDSADKSKSELKKILMEI